MSYHISDKTKQKRRRGTGSGANYTSYIDINEYTSSLGTRAGVIDVFHNRQISCMSQGERILALQLLWDFNIKEIHEQVPLDINVTNRIARELGYKPMRKGSKPMTSDFVAYLKSGKTKVFSVKYNSQQELPERKRELQEIERKYWEEQGAEWILVYRDELNPILAYNIRCVLEYYDDKYVKSDIDMVKHRIAHKEIIPECFETKKLTIADYMALLEEDNS